jgi:hypothetical protein
MENLALQYIRKIKNYPAEVDKFFESDAFNKSLATLSEKYNLDESWFLDTVYRLVIADFDFKVFDKEVQALDILPLRQKELTKSFLLSLIAPIAFMLPKEMALELKIRGLNDKDIANSSSTIIDIVEDEGLDKLRKAADNYNEAWNPIEEENDIIDLIDNDLIDVLKNPDDDSTETLNSSFFRVLNRDRLFKEKASKALYINNLILTDKPFSFDGRNSVGTVANWLKDFINQNGSSYFNALVLSKFVASSENAKSLDSQEKKLLTRLLKFYRNLSFYPESLNNVPVEEWEIVPFEHLSDQSTKILSAKPAAKASVQDKPEIKTEEPKVELTKEPEKTAEPVLATETMVVEPIIEEPIAETVAIEPIPEAKADIADETKVVVEDKFAQIKSLSDLAEQFPVGSLERKAIDEEIKKLM